MTYKNPIVFFLIIFLSAVSFEVLSGELPPLADGQWSQEKAAQLAKVFNDVVQRQNEGKPVSDDEVNEAIMFVGWAKGFAEGIVMAERGEKRQDVTRCMGKLGYDLAPHAIAKMLAVKNKDKPRPQNSDAQSSAYGGLIIYCKIQEMK